MFRTCLRGRAEYLNLVIGYVFSVRNSHGGECSGKSRVSTDIGVREGKLLALAFQRDGHEVGRPLNLLSSGCKKNRLMLMNELDLELASKAQLQIFG